MTDWCDAHFCRSSGLLDSEGLRRVFRNEQAEFLLWGLGNGILAIWAHVSRLRRHSCHSWDGYIAYLVGIQTQHGKQRHNMANRDNKHSSRVIHTASHSRVAMVIQYDEDRKNAVSYHLLLSFFCSSIIVAITASNPSFV